VHSNRHDPQRFISVKDLLDGRIDPARIAGKLVLIGTSAVGFNGLKPTPTTTLHSSTPPLLASLSKTQAGSATILVYEVYAGSFKRGPNAKGSIQRDLATFLLKIHDR